MTTILEGQTALTSIEELTLDAIDPATDNPRGDVGDVSELAQTIKTMGLLQPLIVTPRDDRYLLVVGHRRYAAAIMAGLETVPAIVREMDEPTRKHAMLVENCQREDLTTLEEARAYAGLVELGLSQRKIADAVGRTQSHISKRLQLLELPEPVVEQVDSGGITIADALELVQLKDHPKRMQRIIDRPSWQTIAYAVAQEHAAIERETKVAAAKAELKAKGVTPVKMQYGDPVPPAKRLGEGWNRVAIAEKTHAALPCHSYGVTQEGSIVAVCTAPDNHASEQQSTSARQSKLTAAEKAAEKERKALEDAAGWRHEFIGDVARGKVTKDDVVDLALYATFAIDFWRPYEWACRALDVPIAEAIEAAREATTAEEAADVLEHRYDDLEADVAERALTAYAAGSATNKLRAAFALAAYAIDETYLHGYDFLRGDGSSFSPSTPAAAAALFTVLGRHGYEISKAEKKRLDALTKATS